MAKRMRPEDGGVRWRDDLHAFECYGCGGFEEVRSAARRVPDVLAEIRELLVLDHTECWEFDDPKMARDARRHRKEKKRRELLKSRAGRALDRQSASWRGR